MIYWLNLSQEPNPEDPLNKEAAEVLQSNRRLFESNVAKAMRGHNVGGTYFECCLKWYIKSKLSLCVYLIILTLGGRIYINFK